MNEQHGKIYSNSDNDDNNGNDVKRISKRR